MSFFRQYLGQQQVFDNPACRYNNAEAEGKHDAPMEGREKLEQDPENNQMSQENGHAQWAEPLQDAVLQQAGNRTRLPCKHVNKRQKHKPVERGIPQFRVCKGVNRQGSYQ